MDILNQVKQGVENMVSDVKQGVSNLLAENLDPDLKPLQDAHQIEVTPRRKEFCCSCTKIPQHYYAVGIGEGDQARNIFNIMHGKQESSITCKQCCIYACKQRCGKGCGLFCTKFCRCCSNFCFAFCATIKCKALANCCASFTKWDNDIEKFNDYENALELVHKQTALGWPDSEKDGLYVGQRQLAVGGVYVTEFPRVTDWLSKDKNVEFETQSSDRKEESFKDKLENSDLPGVPKIDEKVHDQITYCLACLSCVTPSQYVLNKERAAEFMDCYAIHYKDKFIGRYLLGERKRILCEMCCPCCIADGYTRRDDIHLLDQYDRLIYRFEQETMGCFQAHCKKRQPYNLTITDPKGQDVGKVSLRFVPKCCCPIWTFLIIFPQNATPLQKLLITYVAAYINEKKLDFWNTGDSHNLTAIENDTHFSKLQPGQNTIIWDKVTDKMDYKSIGMTEIPSLVASMAENPSRMENENIKWETYDGNHAIQREFIRKKKMRVRFQMMKDFLEKAGDKAMKKAELEAEMEAHDQD